MYQWFRGLAIASTLIAAPAVGYSADFNKERTVPQKEWSVIVSPYVWGASLNGSGSLAGFNTNVDIPFSEVFKNLDLAVMGNVEITNGQWGVYFDGQYVKTSQEEHVFDNQIGLGINTTMLSAGGFFELYETELGGDTVFGKPRTLSIEPTAGVRWTKLQADVTAFGTQAEKSADWTDPFVGVRVNADLTDRWNLFSEIDVGGFGLGSNLSVNAATYLGYRTTMFGNPTVLRAGYRLLYQNYEGDDFTGANKFRWNVTQQGPVVGFSMQF